mmetsp:Transcript_124623/g.360519  ORF Transcript_124623/g.360519 Transcript_124623/m.360519 type:complete len:321 (-) Transcript_124623:49-1011(-)
MHPHRSRPRVQRGEEAGGQHGVEVHLALALQREEAPPSRRLHSESTDEDDPLIVHLPRDQVVGETKPSVIPGRRRHDLLADDHPRLFGAKIESYCPRQSRWRLFPEAAEKRLHHTVLRFLPLLSWRTPPKTQNAHGAIAALLLEHVQGPPHLHGQQRGDDRRGHRGDGGRIRGAAVPEQERRVRHFLPRLAEGDHLMGGCALHLHSVGVWRQRHVLAVGCLEAGRVVRAEAYLAIRAVRHPQDVTACVHQDLHVLGGRAQGELGGANADLRASQGDLHRRRQRQGAANERERGPEEQRPAMGRRRPPARRRHRSAATPRG